jgi:hypothetical protein
MSSSTRSFTSMKTRALDPLEPTAKWEEGESAETLPSGL